MRTFVRTEGGRGRADGGRSYSQCGNRAGKGLGIPNVPQSLGSFHSSKAFLWTPRIFLWRFSFSQRPTRNGLSSGRLWPCRGARRFNPPASGSTLSEQQQGVAAKSALDATQNVGGRPGSGTAPAGADPPVLSPVSPMIHGSTHMAPPHMIFSTPFSAAAAPDSCRGFLARWLAGAAAALPSSRASTCRDVCLVSACALSGRTQDAGRTL